MGSISGLGSGLDINAIVSKLMQVEKNNQTRIQAKRDLVQGRLDAYKVIQEKLGAVRSAASSLRLATNWNVYSATSSDSDVATVSTTSSAANGSLTFTVDHLATANTVRSTQTVSSLNSTIASGRVVVGIAAGLGVSALQGSNDLAGGTHTIAVTQSSAAAVKTGTTALASDTVVEAGVNDTLDVSIDGVATTLTFAPGSYTRQALADEVATLTDGALIASVDDNNTLALTTAREGSAASIHVTGGLALGDLGLVADDEAITGTDGIIAINGTATTLENVMAGNAFTVDADIGTISGTFAGGLRVGTTTVANVSVGTGTLASAVSAINAARVGVSATAIKTGTNQYRLQLTSQSTGENNRMTVDPALFDAFGGSTTIDAGTDSVITVGQGAGAFSITSSSNTVTDALPGVTFALKKESTSAVTVNIARNVDAIAANIQKVVDTANDLTATLAKFTKYDADKKQSSLLTGDATLRRIQSALLTAVTSAVPTSSIASAGIVGLSTQRDGTLAFDKSKFTTQMNDDPEGVRSLFVAQINATDASVTLSSVGERVRSGTYGVAITTAATRAEKSGTDLSGSGAAITGAETISVKVGAKTVSYAATAGSSLASIANGLNTAMSAQDLRINASVESGALVLRAFGYGAGEKFSVKSDNVDSGQTGLAGTADAWTEYAGVDVAGTIDGRTAKGRGQVLTASVTDPAVPLLALRIEATSPGSLGSVTFDPGVGHRVTNAMALAIDPLDGSLTAAMTGKKSEIESLTRLDDDWTRRLAQREKRLRAQFATLDTTMGSLNSQSAWLTSQISSLNAKNS